jgi:DNA polymerase-1
MADRQNVMVQADYKQAELRILSWLAQDIYFRDILNDDSRDLFDELTPNLRPDLPLKDELLAMQMFDGQKTADFWASTRVRVKAFVYGLSYGRKAGSIAAEYKMPLSEANGMAKRFFDLIPEVVEFQNNVKAHVKAGRDLITPFGRHRRFHLITEENWWSIQNEALAFLPQSTSSDVCLRAFVRLRPQLRGTGAFLRNIVHDSILLDCPPDIATDMATLLDQEMVRSAHELVGDYVTFRTDVAIGKHWGEV